MSDRLDLSDAIQLSSVSSALPACPNCDSEAIVKNGLIHNGKQNLLCKDCGRRFGARSLAPGTDAGRNLLKTRKTKRLVTKQKAY